LTEGRGRGAARTVQDVMGLMVRMMKVAKVAEDRVLEIRAIFKMG
jgi:hypothetical protein